MISNALDRSKNTVIGNLPISRYCEIRSTISKEAYSVECNFLKPYWLLYNRSLFVKYSYTWLKTTFSNVFEMDDSNDIER